LGDELVSNNTFVTNLGDELVTNNEFVENITNMLYDDTHIKQLLDSIANLIGENNVTNFIQEIVNQISQETYVTQLGDSIANYFSQTALGDTILNYIINNIPEELTYTADESTLTLSSDNEFSVKDLGITNGKIANNAIDSTKIQDGSISLNDLRNGTAVGQIMQWNGSRWVLTSAASVVKKLEVIIDSSYTILSSNYTGETGATTKPIEVVGIEPVIKSAGGNGISGSRFIARNLSISTTAIVENGQIAYTLRIKNDNIDSAKSFTVEKLNIFYTCDETLGAGTTPDVETYAGQ
jgi:hypothetical protein